jgi:hypothetical protein
LAPHYYTAFAVVMRTYQLITPTLSRGSG